MKSVKKEAINKGDFVLLKCTVFRYWNTFLNVIILHIILKSISYLCYFANTLLSVYFIFILDYGNYIRQKANSINFLI